jgi:class 3 adenylate cyclase
MAAAGPRSEGVHTACERIRRYLEHGAPWDACDVFREALPEQSGDADLLYWGALAHARAGATRQAFALLDRAQAEAASAAGPLDEILSLRGRLWKDGYHRARDAATQSVCARRARDEYLAAYTLRHENTYPGINAATLSLLLGDAPVSRALAQGILSQLAAQTTPLTFWEHATAGEAHLLLGQAALARRSYAAAYERAPDDAGNVATMRRQVNLLARVLPEAAEVLDLLPPACVLAFAGHLMDAPGRAMPRFPHGMEPAVEASIREHLSRLKQPTVYTSAACGADLIFIEVALELGAEVNVVLPFDRQDFVRTSVAVAGEAWVQRFDRALARATRLIWATEESYLGDEVLFDHSAGLIEGLSVLRASQLQTQPELLCVIDPDSDGEPGGALASFERWRQIHGAPQVINLRTLREGGAASRPPVSIPGPADPHGFTGTSGDLVARPKRTLKTMLFADFSGFGRLHDAFAPLFHAHFLAIVAAEIEACAAKPLEANTWGDALYVVFESVHDGAEFALGLLGRMLEVDWTAAGLSETSQIRIALHAGPVFCGFDPIMGRDNYFGSSVTKTARIEPVTPPGMVYASEAFAATLAASGKDDFTFEYMGRLALAKGYGESRIYRLERR